MEIDIIRNATCRLEVIGGDLVSAFDDSNFNGLYKHGLGLGLRTNNSEVEPLVPLSGGRQNLSLDAGPQVGKILYWDSRGVSDEAFNREG
jgi:hypothetical protein